jgi:hypothetical protein
MEPLLAPFVPCPCGLTYEYLVLKNRVDDDDNCKAKWADQSGRTCGRPLGAHLHAHALVQDCEIQSQLRNGLPILEAMMSDSSAYIPNELEHARCFRQERDFPYIPVLDQSILNAKNDAWTSARGAHFSYATEADVVFVVRSFLESVLKAMSLPLKFSAEFSIQRIRPDLSLILNGNYLVGVIEVKKPTPGVMQQETVLGELFDQLMLVEGFYGMGPALGILTTGQEWIFSWFPADHDTLCIRSTASSFTTPKKQKLSTPEPKTSSPPGNTPSQKSGNVHSIDEDEEEEELEVEVDSPVDSPVERLLSVTSVIDIHQNPEAPMWSFLLDVSLSVTSSGIDCAMSLEISQRLFHCLLSSCPL